MADNRATETFRRGAVVPGSVADQILGVLGAHKDERLTLLQIVDMLPECRQWAIQVALNRMVRRQRVSEAVQGDEYVFFLGDDATAEVSHA